MNMKTEDKKAVKSVKVVAVVEEETEVIELKVDSKFEQAFALNVNKKTEKKKDLTYLSWAWAWAEFKKIYTEATFKVKMFEGKPFVYDEILGYMVFTEVTAGGITQDMWLPVMNGANKAMKNAPYKYTTKYGEKTVEAATMFDINKTLMRCFAKNLAIFGLGLYIYAGEDLPEVVEEEKPKPVMATTEQKKEIADLFEILQVDKEKQESWLKSSRKVDSVNKLTKKAAQSVIDALKLRVKSTEETKS